MNRIPRRLRCSRSNRERGTGALDLVMVSAFLLIPAAMLLLSLPLMVEYRSMADAAAREAVRACAVDSDSDRQARAEAIARQILGERGLSPQGTMVKVNCDTAWHPGRVVTARVSFKAPAVSIIGFGNIGAVTIERTYCEKIEQTRNLPTQEHRPKDQKCGQIENP